MKNSIDNIKDLIKSLYQIVDKSSTGITIRSMQDAAQIISKMHGFNSWNDLKQNLGYLKKEYTSNYSQKAVMRGIEDVRIKKNDSYIPLHTSKKEKILEQPVERELLQDIIIGHNYNPVMKSSHYLHLEPEDFALISSIDNSQIIKNIKNQLKNFNNSSIHLTSQSNIKLDPWSHIFEQNGIELLFHIKDHKNDFMISWISTMRYLNNEINFHPTIKEALHYLTLPGIAGVYDWLKNNKPNAAWYMERYLEQIGVVENKGDYFISADAQEKHWFNIEKEVYILESLTQLYKSKVFQSQERDILWESFIGRKNIKIGMVDNLHHIYKEFVAIEINRVAEQYDKLILNKLTDNFKIWLFCDNLEDWETSSLLSLQDRECLIRGYLTQGKTPHLYAFIHNFEQILLGKLLGTEIPYALIEKMLNKTQVWGENIWFDDKKALRHLEHCEVFLWHAKKDMTRIKELRDFICEKCICTANE